MRTVQVPLDLQRGDLALRDRAVVGRQRRGQARRPVVTENGHRLVLDDLGLVPLASTVPSSMIVAASVLRSALTGEKTVGPEPDVGRVGAVLAGAEDVDGAGGGAGVAGVRAAVDRLAERTAPVGLGFVPKNSALTLMRERRRRRGRRRRRAGRRARRWRQSQTRRGLARVGRAPCSGGRTGRRSPAGSRRRPEIEDEPGPPAAWGCWPATVAL